MAEHMKVPVVKADMILEGGSVHTDGEGWGSLSYPRCICLDASNGASNRQIYIAEILGCRADLCGWKAHTHHHPSWVMRQVDPVADVYLCRSPNERVLTVASALQDNGDNSRVPTE